MQVSSIKKAPTGEACLPNGVKQGNMGAKVKRFFEISKKRGIFFKNSFIHVELLNFKNRKLKKIE